MALNKKNFCIVFFLQLVPLIVVAQISSSIGMEVKLSENYHWGEGFSEERQQAIELAHQDLSQKIIVMISSIQRHEEIEKDGIYNSEFQSKVQAKSRVQLRNLKVNTNQRRDGSWEALVYISKKEYEENLQKNAQEQLSKLNYGLSLEENGRFERAMAIFSEIYLLTAYHPGVIYTVENVHGTRKEIRSYVRAKILDWLEEISISTAEIYDRSSEEQTEIYIDLEVTHRNEPVNGLLISINRPGYGMHKVIDGKTSIYYDRPLEESQVEMQFRLKPDPDAIAHPDVEADLGYLLPESFLTMTIDFTEVITFDIAVNKLTEKRFKFSPVLKNLTVFDIEWEVNGEAVSKATMLDHTFSSLSNPQQITLRLNRNPGFYVTKEISQGGDVMTVSSFREKNEKQIQPKTELKEQENLSLNKTDFVKNAHAGLLNEIVGKKAVAELTQYLSSLQQKRVLKFGNRTEVSNTTESYIAIVDPQKNQVVAFLTPQVENHRYNLTAQELIKSDQIQVKFSGYGPIWFQFSRN